MMQSVPTSSDLCLYVYQQPVHPELFEIYLEKRIQSKTYEADMWIVGLGHIVSFYSQGRTITECVCKPPELLPRKHLLTTVDLNRNRTYKTNYDNYIYYVVETQYEKVSKAVFERSYEELGKYGKRKGLYIVYEHWGKQMDSIENESVQAGFPFSFVDYSYRANELSVFCYHGFAKEQVIVKTQSVFSTKPIRGVFKV